MLNKTVVKYEVPKINKSKTPPRSVKVIIHDDKVTPYPVVFDVLLTVFQRNEQQIDSIIDEAEKNGKAIVCVTTNSIADNLIKMAGDYIAAISKTGIPIDLRFSKDEE